MCFDLDEDDLVWVQADAIIEKLAVRIDALIAVPGALCAPVDALIPAATDEQQFLREPAESMGRPKTTLLCR